jgi:hypothetical protein
MIAVPLAGLGLNRAKERPFSNRAWQGNRPALRKLDAVSGRDFGLDRPRGAIHAVLTHQLFVFR